MDGNGEIGGGRREGGDLRAFVRRAWESPGEWHYVPDHPLALRFPPRGRLSGKAEFKICKVGDDGNGPHGHYRAGRGAVPEFVSEDAREHKDLSFAGFPEKKKDFASAVVSVLDEWPDSRLAGWQAELVRWYRLQFESRTNLSQFDRLRAAFAGTIVFSLAILAGLQHSILTSLWYPRETPRETIAEIQTRIGVGEWEAISLFGSPSAVSPVLVIVSFSFSAIIAALCSWNSRVNSPLRLSIIVFALSYVVFGVSQTMFSGPSTSTDTSQITIPDDG